MRGKAKPYTAWAKRDLLEKGYVVDDTERKNCFSGHKNDLFGFGDLLAMKRGPTPCNSRRLIVQVTSGSNHLARVKKILGKPIAGKIEDPNLVLRTSYALHCGFEIIVMSYEKINRRWQLLVQAITLKDFPKHLR